MTIGYREKSENVFRRFCSSLLLFSCSSSRTPQHRPMPSYFDFEKLNARQGSLPEMVSMLMGLISRLRAHLQKDNSICFAFTQEHEKEQDATR
jgi:hypothetical protein